MILNPCLLFFAEYRSITGSKVIILFLCYINTENIIVNTLFLHLRVSFNCTETSKLMWLIGTDILCIRIREIIRVRAKTPVIWQIP